MKAMQAAELRKKLSNLLLKINEGERHIEILRQALCEQESFEPYAAFKRLEHSAKGSLAVSDILKFLNENKVPHIEEFCSAFLKRYDLDSDGKLRYPEFLNVVLPANNPVLRCKATQRATYKISQDEALPYQVEYALSRVLDREISFYSSINPLKVTLSILPGFSYVEAFAELDIGGVGLVSLSSLKDFFKMEGVSPSDEDLKAILRRFDKDNDGFVKFDEFVEGIKPFDEKSSLITEELKTEAIPKVSPLKAKISEKTEIIQNPLADKVKASPIVERIREKPETTHNPLRNRVHYSPLRDQIREKTTEKPDIAQNSLRNKVQTSPLVEKKTPLTESANKFASPLSKTSKYAQKLYSERARKIIEQTISPVIENKTSPKREIDNEITSKETEIISPKRQRKEVSPYKRPFAYTELPKSSTNFTSPLEGGTSTEKEAKEGENNRDKEFEKNLSGTKRALSKHLRMYSTGKKSPEPRENKRKEIDLFSEKNYKIVVETLNQFIFLDKEIETAKKDLDLQMDFSLLDVFKTFDLSFKGVIKSQEIIDAMKIYGVYPDKEELYLFMRRFDKNGLEELSLNDFSNIFRPRQHDLMTKRTPKTTDEKQNKAKLFTEETRKLIAKVLRLHLENERASERLRQNIQKKANLDLRDIFKRIDKTDDGFLTSRKLKKCLEENQIYVIDKEIDLLMERLDTNGDGKVSYVEFLQEITPKCK